MMRQEQHSSHACRLPLTIIPQIALELHDDMALRTLSGLATTSRSVYATVNPILWRTLTISQIYRSDVRSDASGPRPLEVIGRFFEGEDIRAHLDRLDNCLWDLGAVLDSLRQESNSGPSTAHISVPSTLRILCFFRHARTLEMDTREIFQDTSWLHHLQGGFEGRDYILFPRVDTLILGASGKEIRPFRTGQPHHPPVKKYHLMYELPRICRPSRICCNTAEERRYFIWPRLVGHMPSVREVWIHWNDTEFGLPKANAHFHYGVKRDARIDFVKDAALALCDTKAPQLRLEVQMQHRDGSPTPDDVLHQIEFEVRISLRASTTSANEVERLTAACMSRVSIKHQKDFWECGVCRQNLWGPSLLKPPA